MAKVALVTGGAKRVGRAVALCLAEAGMDIAFTWHTSEAEAKELEQAIVALGRQVLAIQCDISQPKAVELIHSAVMQKFNRLDALINNASCFEPSTMGQLSTQQFDRAMAINARFPLLLTQAFQAMLAANYQADDPQSAGRVVNFIDTNVLGEPLRDYLSYNASKAALKESTSSCALELDRESVGAGKGGVGQIARVGVRRT